MVFSNGSSLQLKGSAVEVKEKSAIHATNESDVTVTDSSEISVRNQSSIGIDKALQLTVEGEGRVAAHNNSHMNLEGTQQSSTFQLFYFLKNFKAVTFFRL